MHSNRSSSDTAAVPAFAHFSFRSSTQDGSANSESIAQARWTAHDDNNRTTAERTAAPRARAAAVDILATTDGMLTDGGRRSRGRHNNNRPTDFPDGPRKTTTAMTDGDDECGVVHAADIGRVR